MSDRELLELAAKAVNGGCWHPLTHSKPWNPLEDDGDALRLAVQLNIRLTIFEDTVVKSRAAVWRDGNADCALWEPEGSDPLAATRRAIVRAAAEIAKAREA
ncbi:TPA: hypothetical protein QDA94_003027 [Burkholderia vietnamiensis]|uniref:hypothetical protein n=1 Tax=Burkholderia vietnamiensis TaxID=60552 RepID=UPI001B97DE1B|nr:hypothetical protein [Burkholderia vietnamiensis]MBR8188583.1 hypothetical protein [Burkholderia vietnamiensis]HDR9048795.1 hypothetical protein [Burkholderia vietnamiensis]HDR9231355.1 hypothetical protein [Burkholderia vietnamiensis]